MVEYSNETQKTKINSQDFDCRITLICFTSTAIPATTASTTTLRPGPEPRQSGTLLSTNSVIGIVVGIFSLLALVGCTFAIFLFRSKRHIRGPQERHQPSAFENFPAQGATLNKPSIQPKHVQFTLTPPSPPQQQGLTLPPHPAQVDFSQPPAYAAPSAPQQPAYASQPYPSDAPPPYIQ